MTPPEPINPESQPPPVGVLVLDKPEGISSMKAVAIVRARANRAKTGQAGTLDPLATGVLVLALGRAATKHIDAMMGTDKRYHTLINLEAFTNTDDREGEREMVEVASPPDEETVRQAIRGFVGEIMQKPPAFSAIKIDGRRAYKQARKGEVVDIPARAVIAYGIDLIRYDWPEVELEVHCAKGFYIRSLARNLGESLRTGGYCLSIRRTGVGPFTIDQAMALDDVPNPLKLEDLIPIETALERIARHKQVIGETTTSTE
ncbi:MAG: tRNA pseudouridine(55) synthase TruB [Planctomycetota bacterium]|nr:tRNA pseudouridine(55) synthase TruB [Planctomycetota bacterium]